ncbi:MAG: NAD-dependent epimerase/dehydratase family protein [Chloroflexi bacterium]|nr:NAD-dependent epimerase/dehydratase family protein [Chloroflexota bacterium]
MRILVTGAAGFVGSHLSERLLAEGHEVVGLDSFNPYYARSLKERNLSAALEHPAYRFIEADLRSAALESVLDGVDAVVHQAAMAGLPRSWDNFEEYMTCNVLASQRLLEAARLSSGVGRLVFISTSSVYGRMADGDETTLPRPISPYGATKLCAERLALAYQESYGLPVIVLRYFSVYGPRQRPDMAYQIFISRVLKGEPITIFGDGSQSRSNTYIDDAVEATSRALDRGEVGEVYNIGGGEARDLSWIVRTIEELAGREAQLNYGPPRKGDQLHTRADIRRARAALGYEPTTPLIEGLRRQVEWNLSLET